MLDIPEIILKCRHLDLGRLPQESILEEVMMRPFALSALITIRLFDTKD